MGDKKRFQTRLRRVWNRFIPNESQVSIYHNQGVVDCLFRSPINTITSLTLSQWSSSGLPVAIQCSWNLDPSVHWNATGERIVGSQCVSSVLPVVFQWLSSGLPVCSNYANKHWITTVIPLGANISQCGSSGIPVYLWLQWYSSVFQLCKLTLDRHWNTTGC